MKVIQTQKAPAAVGPYSQAIEVNGLIFTSGQLPIIPESGELINDDIKKATARSLENIKEILEAAGSSLDKVVKTTCFLKDINDFKAFNEIYAKYIKEKPARSCIAAADLPGGFLVEVEVIAEI